MLGNLKPYTRAMDEDEKLFYTSCYCGLCRSLGDIYGLLAKNLLTFDMALVSMFCDALSDGDTATEEIRCPFDGLKKRTILKSSGSVFASHVTIALAYFKMQDDGRDGSRGTFQRVPKAYISSRYEIAKEEIPSLCEVFSAQSEKQVLAENESSEIDVLCMPTAIMTRRIFEQCRSEKYKKHAQQFGFFLGRAIYLMDAFIDRDADRKKGNYNFFNLKNYSREDARRECFMSLGEAGRRLEMLPPGEYRKAAENIIYLSAPRFLRGAAEEQE